MTRFPGAQRIGQIEPRQIFVNITFLHPWLFVMFRFIYSHASLQAAAEAVVPHYKYVAYIEQDKRTITEKSR